MTSGALNKWLLHLLDDIFKVLLIRLDIKFLFQNILDSFIQNSIHFFQLKMFLLHRTVHI